MELSYYPGCTLHSSSALYDVQVRLVLGRLGVTLRELLDWSCCGATSAGKVDAFLATAMPARNLGIAEAAGLPEMLIPCSACYSRTLVAAGRLQADPALAAEINAGLRQPATGAIKVSSILEVLEARIRAGGLKGRVVKPLAALQPACYYGCMLTRFPEAAVAADDVENPRSMERILAAAGARPLDWSFKTDCCGASAGVNDRATALALMGRIMRDAVARGADCLVTSCPMCQMNMDAYQEEFCRAAGIEARLPVYFITELLGVALGIPAADLQLERHIIDALPLLKRHNLT